MDHHHQGSQRERNRHCRVLMVADMIAMIHPELTQTLELSQQGGAWLTKCLRMHWAVMGTLDRHNMNRQDKLTNDHRT